MSYMKTTKRDDKLGGVKDRRRKGLVRRSQSSGVQGVPFP
jgi:hypothetical protein